MLRIKKILPSSNTEMDALFTISTSPSHINDDNENDDNKDDDKDGDDDNEYNNDDDDDDDEYHDKEYYANKNLEDLVFGNEDNIESDIEIEQNIKKRKNLKSDSNKKKLAKWVDEDDENEEFSKLQKPSIPTWAIKKKINKVDKDSDDDDADDGDGDDGDIIDDNDIVWRTGNYLAPSKFLPSHHLKIQRCSNLNSECPIKGIIRCVEFLKKSQVAMVAGADSKVHIFQVDTKANRKIQSIAVEKFPIFCAHFNCEGDEIIMGSRVPSLYSYNMIEGKIIRYAIKGLDYVTNTKSFILSPDGKYIALIGKFGYIYLLSAKTKEVISSLKVDSESIESIAFTEDASKLISHTSEGIINIWDVSSRKRINHFMDEGCNRGSAVAISPQDRYLAAGSYSGVVNIYDKECLTSGKTSFKPLKSIMNLTQPCSRLSFNASSEVLAIASSYEENAVKLLHIPSLSVFSNFPAATEKMSTPYSIDFSPNSGFLTIGTSTGRALLYRLKHYINY